jgi:hypothetical protein
MDMAGAIKVCIFALCILVRLVDSEAGNVPPGVYQGQGIKDYNVMGVCNARELAYVTITIREDGSVSWHAYTSHVGGCDDGGEFIGYSCFVDGEGSIKGDTLKSEPIDIYEAPVVYNSSETSSVYMCHGKRVTIDDRLGTPKGCKLTGRVDNNARLFEIQNSAMCSANNLGRYFDELEKIKLKPSKAGFQATLLLGFREVPTKVSFKRTGNAPVPPVPVVEPADAASPAVAAPVVVPAAQGPFQDPFD